MPSHSKRLLKLNALRLEQNLDSPLYVFGVDGRLIHQLASVQPANRSADGVLSGYQRTRVERHIAEIHEYLETDHSILPNAIVLALREEVTFEPIKGSLRNEWGTPGVLLLPLPGHHESKPCVIVDGQQRVAALAELASTRVFPVVVVAFQSLSEDHQRDQFILVNKTKPLPRDLVNELLPGTTVRLPKGLALKRVASTVLEQLRFDYESPFYGRIRGLGVGSETNNISPLGLLDVITSSIRKKGVLFEYWDPNGTKHNIRGMALVLKVFYGGVKRTWPKAWAENPWTSRLVHGVGIVAMGSLMERVMNEVPASSPRAEAMVHHRLERLKDECAWTEADGDWPELDVPWNWFQNTSQDKQKLASYLLSVYRGYS